MLETFNAIMEIIGAYEILNNVIPGAIYIFLVDKYTSFHFLSGDFFSDAIVFYFAGLVIGPIGSSFRRRPSIKNSDTKIKDRFMLRFRLLLWPKSECSNADDNYEEYIRAEQEDSKIPKLLLVCNMYRTFASVAICVIVTILLSILKEIVPITHNPYVKTGLVILFCAVLFLIFRSAFIKQSQFIKYRIKRNIKQKKEL